MTFLFVDRIFSIEPGKSIHAMKNATRNEGFYYWMPNGKRVLSPAVITEALAQAGAWLKMATFDFKKRPVLLADDVTRYYDFVEAGDQIDLFVDILRVEEDVVMTRSRAEVRGKTVVSVQCCRGYMMPMEEFSDERDVRNMYKNLFRPELASVNRIVEVEKSLPAIAGKQSFETLRFVDGLLNHEPGKRVSGFKNFTMCEPYFREHFPRKPVVPGVLLTTFIGEVCQYLIKEDINIPMRARALVPLYMQNLRFRKFVEPGDQCILKAEIMKGDCSVDGEEILVSATIMANDKRVMSGEMGFITMLNSHTPIDVAQRPKFINLDSPSVIN